MKEEEIASWIQKVIENNSSETATIIILEGLAEIEKYAAPAPVPDKVEAKKFLTDFINEIEKEFAGDNLEYLHYAADRFLNNRNWQSTQSDAVEGKFVDGIYCPGCGDQMNVKEVKDNKCSECGAELDL